MKRIFLLSVAIALTSSSLFAKVWRINNNIGITADFTMAQQAHDNGSVQPGDTLYFEHSSLTYGGLLLAKSLKLIGAGYFLSANPGVQYTTTAPRLDGITVVNSAANSVISVSSTSIFLDSVNNVRISRCWIGGDLTLYGSSNTTISNCFINQNISIQAKVFNNSVVCKVTGCAGTSIFNNIIAANLSQEQMAYGGICTPNWVMPHSSTVFNNSIFGMANNFTGSFYNNTAVGITLSGGSSASNNIFYNTIASSKRRTYTTPGSYDEVTLEPGNSNQFNFTRESLFTNVVSAQYLDTSWKLTPGSAAIGAGTGGVDCGATGGNAAFQFGMPPAIPTIYKLNVAPAASGNSIGVTISTKSNN
ncbi:MAG: hypothetical protein V4722_24775 [Bacteroidota bacterium]